MVVVYRYLGIGRRVEFVSVTSSLVFSLVLEVVSAVLLNSGRASRDGEEEDDKMKRGEGEEEGKKKEKTEKEHDVGK